MMVYIYAADLYCEECGAKICDELAAPEDPENEYSYDSDDYPKGPYEASEADCPHHCAGCGEFLETPLTDEGAAYVIEAVKRAREDLATKCRGLTPDQVDDEQSYSVALSTWAPFYDYLDFGDPADDDPGVEECPE